MAEEEAGFTFVDKRRTKPEEAPVSAAPATNEALEDTPVPQFSEAFTSEAVAAEPEFAEVGVSPTTYDLIGYCINLLASQAWQKLGLLVDPQTGDAQPDFLEAKVAIDTVGDLAARLDSAPDSAVPADLRRDLRTLLNDLRLNYVSQRGPAA